MAKPTKNNEATNFEESIRSYGDKIEHIDTFVEAVRRFPGMYIGAKSEMYTLMEELASQGKSVIMISSELSEVQRLSDRVIVMCEGRKTAELDIADATQEEIMKYATMREEE